MSTLPAPGAPVDTVRWFTRPVLPCAQFPTGLAGCLVLHRNGVDDAMYDVVVNCNWFDPQKPHEPLLIRGWRLLGRKRGSKVYDVCFQPGQEGCDCPDGTYRSERPCKHWRAVKDGLQAIGLPLQGLVRTTSPSSDELQAIFRQLPAHWFARPEQRLDGTWTIVATYHFDMTLRVVADAADELVALVCKADVERLDQVAAKAAAAMRRAELPPPPSRVRRYVDVSKANRLRSERFSRAGRWGVESPPQTND